MNQIKIFRTNLTRKEIDGCWWLLWWGGSHKHVRMGNELWKSRKQETMRCLWNENIYLSYLNILFIGRMVSFRWMCGCDKVVASLAVNFNDSEKNIYEIGFGWHILKRMKLWSKHFRFFLCKNSFFIEDMLSDYQKCFRNG